MATVRVFVDGTLGRPQLDHPEGIAVAPDGALWCGGERGQIYRVEPDGSAIREITTSEGFILGLAFTTDGDLFACDLRHHAVWRMRAGSSVLESFTTGIATPNYPCPDPAGGLWVTDSGDQHEATGTILHYDSKGVGGVWAAGPFGFANGLALARDGSELFVVETFASRVSAVAINADGSAGSVRVVAHMPGVLPDGIAFGPDGGLYVGCYEPSRVLRVDVDTAAVTTYADDPTAHLLCHPTNLAWRGEQLFTSNLGRWHLSVIEP